MMPNIIWSQPNQWFFLSLSPSLALCLTAGLCVIFSQLQEIMDEVVLAEEEEKKEECLSSNKIKEMYKMW